MRPVTFLPVLVLLLSQATWAEVGVNEAEDASPAAVPQESTVEFAQSAFDELVSRAQYSEAIEWGERVVELKSDGEERLDLAAAYAQLALVQRQAGEVNGAIANFETAIANYKTAINILETESSWHDKNLADAVLGLSRSQADAGALNDATSSYRKAIDLHRAAYGVRESSQAELLKELSEVYFRMGKYSKADAVQKDYVKLLKKNNPDDKMKILPALYSRADMLARSGKLKNAAENYRRIARIVEQAEGSESLALLPALYKLSDVHITQDLYQRSGMYEGTGRRIYRVPKSKSRIIGENTEKITGGEVQGGFGSRGKITDVVDQKVEHSSLAYRSLQRAIEVAEKNENANAVDKADAHIAMGDFLTLMTKDTVSVLQSYAVAWNYLSSDDEWLDERDARFSGPVALNDIPTIWTSGMRSLFTRPDRENDASGFISVVYDVNDQGRAENFRVIRSEPAGFKDRIVLDHIGNIVFRPEFSDGNPVHSADHTFEISYGYQPDELPEQS